MSVIKFRGKLGGGDAGALFVTIPCDVKKEFGRARPPVRVSINGYTYRSTISVYGGKYYLPIRKERREAAGVKLGDVVEVTIEPDNAVRKVNPPPALSAALAKNGPARAQWETLSYSRKKEHADAILQAKKPETRARRLQKLLETLVGESR
jgi:bifunctional DNA-binding transcriptional regulator/antitoxin component of YhaV-PrlF toxin-antitoxin module